MFCPKCGNKLPSDASFCGKCGEKISGQDQTAPKAVSVPDANATDSDRASAQTEELRPRMGTVPGATAMAHEPIQSARIAAILLLIVALLSGLLSWFEPSDKLVYAANAVSGVSGLTGLLGGQSGSAISLDSSYSLLEMPSAIEAGVGLGEYVDSSDTVFAFNLLWIPFLLWIAAVIVAVVGIAKTLGRTGGESLLTASIRMLLFVCVVAYLFPHMLMGSYLQPGFPIGTIVCFVASILAFIAMAAGSKKRAKRKGE